ncbi:C-terminal processing peptidase-3 [uncultured Paludibacter sp.]|nr:C-terminal processing peptidase-3 [uncultured Paludibacter sp.]
MKKYFLSLVLFITVFAGFAQDQQNQADEDKTFSITKNLSIFNSVLRELDMFYVDKLDYDDLVQTGIAAMLDKLDPYTEYISEENDDDLKMMTTGEYAGIGALIMQVNKEIVIAEPYEGFPAQRNDLRAGDVILEVDGTSTTGKTTAEVSEMLKGKNGTQIVIKVRRPNVTKPIEKKFLRENLQFNSVTYSTIMADNTGYVLIKDFTDKTASEVKTVVSEMVKTNNIQSLIIDLRDNGGGIIDEAVKIVGYFTPKGTEVVTTKGKNKMVDRVYKTPSEPLFPDMKLAVLVNRGSASASEILCGSLQDLDRAVIIGERTFGKGLVQNIRPVGYGGNLKVTIAKYYIPSGRCIQALDYSHRNADGSVGRVPDSLISTFTTKNGRVVRDGGGILPDTITTDTRKINVAYYIYAQNLYFDYATKYFYAHPKITQPAEFKLTDAEFNDFTNYILKEKNFTYTTQTEKYYSQLYDIAKYEGLDKTASAEFEALKAKITPNVAENIKENRKDVEEMLSLEIIKRYYYQKGQIQYSLRDDKEIKTAVGLLKDDEKYNQILKK